MPRASEVRPADRTPRGAHPSSAENAEGSVGPGSDRPDSFRVFSASEERPGSAAGAVVTVEDGRPRRPVVGTALPVLAHAVLLGRPGDPLEQHGRRVLA